MSKQSSIEKPIQEIVEQDSDSDNADSNEESDSSEKHDTDQESSVDSQTSSSDNLDTDSEDELDTDADVEEDVDKPSDPGINLLDGLKETLHKPTLEKQQLEDVYKKLNSQKDVKYFLNTVELLNSADITNQKTSGVDTTHLYPHLDDLDLNLVIAKKMEFNEHKTEITVEDDLEEQSNKLCNKDFELLPHQNFVKNFLSKNTPYNGLLLYHGLGTGKTCSAISIAEETRIYSKYSGLSSKIIIVASPNVQENFKLQLFDPRKLEYKNGNWNLNNCVGNSILSEINTSVNKLSRENIIKMVMSTINKYYMFMGYIEFANYIIKSSNISAYAKLSKAKEVSLVRTKLEKIFKNSLIIIDEIHNIRSTDSKNKLVAKQFSRLVDYVKNLKLVLLSATPMYNDFREIIYLINILNKNDNRSEIDIKDVFDKDGNFITDSNGDEIGKNLFRRKINGYISYIKGDNPLTFPYRIMPEIFSDKSIKKISYPTTQITEKPIKQAISKLDIYTSNIGEYQEKIYNFIVKNILKKIKDQNKTGDLEQLDQIGYIYLQKPIEALNFCYPHRDIDKEIDANNYNYDIKQLVGKSGLNRIMTYQQTSNPPARFNFKFRSNILENIFSLENVGKYSCKIKSIIDNILNSKGPVIVYSQFIDGGLVPLALALESCGFRRYGDNKSLFETHDTEELDIATYKPKSEAIKVNNNFKCAKYVMITGDEYLSPKKYLQKDIKACTDIENINGEKVKVILISMSGSEGLDFKYIRQVHILEPWYNLNRIEQIIGRGVRNCSHKELTMSERNTMIFMHGTILTSKTESCDLFIYRKAEVKAELIGKISRVLKESSVDCLLTDSQQQLTSELLNKSINITLSDNSSHLYKIGDQKYSPICDYMESCYYKCNPNFDGKSSELQEDNLDMSTYDKSYLQTNIDKIIEIIIYLFKEKPFYYKVDIIKHISNFHNYKLHQIDNALDELLTNTNYMFEDRYNNLGSLILIDDIYIFQPLYINNVNDSYYNKTNTLNIVTDKLNYNIPKKFNLKKDDISDSEDADTEAADSEHVDDVGSDSDSEAADSEDSDSEAADSEAADSKDADDMGSDKSKQPEQSKKPVKKIKEDILNKLKLDGINSIDTKKIILDLEFKYEKIINNQYIAKAKKDENVYTQIQTVYNYLSEKLDRETIKTITIQYLIEHEISDKTPQIINYLYENKQYLTSFENKLLMYYNSRIYKIASIEFILTNNNKNIIKFVNDNSIWSVSQPEDDKDFDKNITNIFNRDKVNNIIGFVECVEKLGQYNYVFKTINILEIKNTGARCSQSRKNEIIEQIKLILEGTKYDSILVEYRSLQVATLCIFQEYLLRYFNYYKLDDKVWFMTFEESEIFNLKKLKQKDGVKYYKE